MAQAAEVADRTDGTDNSGVSGTHADMTMMRGLDARVSAGERLEAGDVDELARLDVLTLGRLADTVRRRVAGEQTTFVRTWDVDVSGGWPGGVLPDGASEIRLRGLPASLDALLAAVAAAHEAAAGRRVSGFSLADLHDRADAGWGSRTDVLRRLRDAGLEAVAEAPVDRLGANGSWLDETVRAGIQVPCLTVERTIGPDRVAGFLAVRHLQERSGSPCLAVAPLPRVLSLAAPTTGYGDVTAVALARLIVDNVPHVQVSWPLYGPKLAQVALTFGADDIDQVTTGEEGEGRRPAADVVRQNIAAAGWQAVERTGRYEIVAAGPAGDAA